MCAVDQTRHASLADFQSPPPAWRKRLRKAPDVGGQGDAPDSAPADGDVNVDDDSSSDTDAHMDATGGALSTDSWMPSEADETNATDRPAGWNTLLLTGPCGSG